LTSICILTASGNNAYGTIDPLDSDEGSGSSSSSQIEPTSPRSPSIEPEIPLAPVIFRLYVCKSNVFEKGSMQDTLDFNVSFYNVKAKLTSFVLDKVGDELSERPGFTLTLATRWVTLRVADATPKKGAPLVDARLFVDLERESHFEALKTLLRGSMKKKNPFAGMILQVLASVTIQSSDNDNSQSNAMPEATEQGSQRQV
jgi:hypothetical protein